MNPGEKIEGITWLSVAQAEERWPTVTVPLISVVGQPLSAETEAIAKTEFEAAGLTYGGTHSAGVSHGP